MAKMICKCSYMITESESPNPNIYHLISNINLKKSYDTSAAIKNNLSEMSQFSDNVAANSIFVLICPNCGRLYIFFNKPNITAVYAKEVN